MTAEEKPACAISATPNPCRCPLLSGSKPKNEKNWTNTESHQITQRHSSSTFQMARSFSTKSPHSPLAMERLQKALDTRVCQDRVMQGAIKGTTLRADSGFTVPAQEVGSDFRASVKADHWTPGSLVKLQQSLLQLKSSGSSYKLLNGQQRRTHGRLQTPSAHLHQL
ncbi:Voltage-dependent L-type calcium channel subunit alpha-1S [Manis javanica]|nr:Voltage-dependent L-type calcium channel subunit alpha-1S [Manis javanica]